MKRRFSLGARVPIAVQWSRSDVVDSLVAGLIAATITSGLFTWARMIPALSALPAWLLEVRFAGTLALVVLAIRKLMRVRIQVGEAPWILLPLLALSGFTVLRVLPELPSERSVAYLLQSVYMALHAIAIWVLVQDRAMAWRLLGWLMALGTLLFALAALGFGHPELYGDGWAPIGTPATFYRLEFLGAVAALALTALARNVPGARGIAIVLAGAMTYATLQSLNRIVPIAIAGAVGWMALGLAAKMNYRGLVGIVVGFAAVGAMFAAVRGDFLIHRFDYGIALNKPAPPREEWRAEPDWTYDPWLFEESKEEWRAEPDWTYDPFLYEVGKDRLTPQSPPELIDRTGRFALFVTALGLFRQHPILGAGPNAYTLPKRPSFPGDLVTFYYPHNILLEMMAMSGAVGAALLCLAIGAPLVPALRAAARDDFALILGSYLPYALAASLVSGDLYDFRLYWYVALLLPLIVGAGRGKE